MRFFRGKWVGVSLLGLALFADSTFALGQLSSTGTIRGAVKDATGSNIADAGVSIVNEETRGTVELKSGSDGTFVETDCSLASTMSESRWQALRHTRSNG